MIGKKNECDQQHHLFGQIGGVEVVAVGDLIDVHGLPRDYGIHIEEDPPNQEQSEIECANARVPFVLVEMGKKRESSHHRDQMQEEDDVAGEWVWNFLALENFKVIPHALITEPEEHAAKHEDPESSRASIRITRSKSVGQESGSRDQE